MEWWKIAVLVLVFAILAWGMYDLMSTKNVLTDEVKTLQKSVQALKDENRSLSASIDYYKVPENLLKEVKAQFNYREAGEKLIIIVPNATSTTSTEQ